jgi:hypothetical protein
VTHEEAISPAEQEAKWLKDRTCCATGSRMYDIVGRGSKGQYYKAHYDYIAEKVIERMTGVPQGRVFDSPEIRWGNENEANAVADYRLYSPIQPVIHLGKVFVHHPRIPYSGASPDAYVGDKGGLEIKCPKTSTHWAFLDSGVVPEEYRPQVLWNLACHPTRDFWDFMSFDPRCPEHMVKRVVRIWRSAFAKEIADLEKEVELFNDEVAFQVMKWKAWECPQ